MDNSNIQEIVDNLHACSKKEYSRDEFFKEALELQDEMVDVAFGRKNGSINNLMVQNIVEYYSRLIKKYNINADYELKKFSEEAYIFSREICNYKSGIKGEERTFKMLELLESKSRFLTNVEIGNGKRCTEIDALVITPKCITIVEVKNIKDGVRIEKSGQLSQNGKTLLNLSGKMKEKIRYIRPYLKRVNIDDSKLQSIVVFTNDECELKYNNSNINTCKLADLNEFIESYDGDDVISINQMEELEKIINKERRFGTYKPNINASQLKYDFAVLKCRIADEIENKLIEQAGKNKSESSKNNSLNEFDDVNTTVNVDDNEEGFDKDINSVLEKTVNRRILRLKIVINSI